MREAGEIKDWSGIAKLVADHYKKGWIFRGVRHSAYRLRPSIGRDGARKKSSDGSDLPYSITEERKALRIFKREAAARYGWPTLSGWCLGNTPDCRRGCSIGPRARLSPPTSQLRTRAAKPPSTGCGAP